MKKLIALFVMFSILGLCFAPAVRADGLADDLQQDADQAGQLASDAGHNFVLNAKQAVIYAGKAIVNGVEFIVFKTTQGVILVAKGMVVGLEYAKEGVKFIAIKTKEGIVWVAQKAIEAGKILVNVTVQTAKIVIDGVTYVAVKLAEGTVYLAKKAYEAAKKAGEMVIDGVKFVVKKTKDGIIWVAKATTMYVRRKALVAELRMNITGALAVGGVGEGTMDYFRRKAEDKDPAIAKLGQACLNAAEAFNTVYY